MPGDRRCVLPTRAALPREIPLNADALDETYQRLIEKLAGHGQALVRDMPARQNDHPLDTGIARGLDVEGRIAALQARENRIEEHTVAHDQKQDRCRSENGPGRSPEPGEPKQDQSGKQEPGYDGHGHEKLAHNLLEQKQGRHERWSGFGIRLTSGLFHRE